MAKTLLTPKDLADAIGASESSLRRWIDSGRIKMSRTAGGHRRIELAEALRFIRDAELPVVRPDVLGIAGIDAGAIERARQDHESAASIDPGGDEERLHGALLAGNRALARGLAVSWYLAARSMASIFDGPVRGAMARLGDLWTKDRSGILREHRATDICVEVIHHLRSLLPAARAESGVALGGTPGDDWHSIPSLMAATVAQESGLRDINYGGNLPSDLLSVAADEHDAKLVWLSVTMPPKRALRPQLDQLAQSLEQRGATLVIGGRHAQEACPPRRDNVHCVSSMSELSAFLRGLRA